MNSKATLAIATTLIGCMLNNVFLEYIIKVDPGAGHLITFSQFLFISLHGLVTIWKFGTVKPKIPAKSYLILVVLFFLTSVINNWAFDFNIPVPLHMIFRAGSLIANMIMGIWILKKVYTWDKYLSIGMITSGIIICTLMSRIGNDLPCSDCELNPTVKAQNSSGEHFFWWTIGIILLTGALLLSARMGIYQETIFKVYGKHPEEAMFFTHFLALPGFLLYSKNIIEHFTIASNSPLIEIPFTGISLASLWILLFLNVVTQYLCISSVYILTTECTSLTVTLVITLRKFLSLIFSILYFRNPFTVYHWFGTLLVFVGTLLFTEVIYKKSPKPIVKKTQ